MENNKSYLQRIHWAAIVGLAFYLLLRLIFSDSFLFIQPWDILKYIGTAAVACSFIAVGVVTQKWRATAIAGAVALAIHLVDQDISYNTGRSEIHLYLLLFLRPLPMALLVILHTGWNNKAGMIYLLCMLAGGLGFGQHAATPFLFNRLHWLTGFGVSTFFYFIYYIGSLVSYVIFICEIINFSNGKMLYGKTKLLNLGNIYPKANTVLSFWCLKGAMWCHIVKGITGFESLMKVFQVDGRRSDNFFSDFSVVDVNFYQYLSATISVLGWVITGLLLAWYLRKFMLEAFISFGLRSKLVYWLSLLPFIGFFFLAFNISSARPQQLYIEKRSNITQFVNDNPSSVTATFLLLLGIRLFLLLTYPDTAGLITLVLTAIIFLWMTKEKNGYYVYLGANLLVLAVGVLAMFFADWLAESTAILVGSVLLGAMQVIYLYPAYHFEEFEYIPTEDPGPETTEADGEFHLFPVIK